MLGKIYKIIHSQSNICYVGSTFDELRKRLNKHKNQKTCLISYFEKYGFNQFKIILIKEYEVEDKLHLQMYEQLWINKLKPINKLKAFKLLSTKQIKKQWDKANKAYVKKYNDNHKEEHKAYYEENKEKILEKRKEYHNENKDKMNEKRRLKYQENKDKILEKNKEYQFVNKDKIKEYKKAYYELKKEEHNKKINCECGGIYSNNSKAKHLKTKKHLNYLS